MGNINVSYLRLINGLYLITLIVMSSPVHPPRHYRDFISFYGALRFWLGRTSPVGRPSGVNQPGGLCEM